MLAWCRIAEHTLFGVEVAFVTEIDLLLVRAVTCGAGENPHAREMRIVVEVVGLSLHVLLADMALKTHFIPELARSHLPVFVAIILPRHEFDACCYFVYERIVRMTVFAADPSLSMEVIQLGPV